MKVNTLITTGGLFLILQSAFGQQVGGPVLHELNCSAPASRSGEVRLGVGYRLECTTQALAPHQNLRGCTLYRRTVRPGATEYPIELEMVRQTSRRAVLQAEAAGIRVVVKKSNLSAKVYFNDTALSVCEKP